MNLLELQNNNQKAYKDLQGAFQLVEWSNTQAGWGFIYERIDSTFIAMHAQDNFGKYAARCQELSDAAELALREGIAQAKKAKA